MFLLVCVARLPWQSRIRASQITFAASLQAPVAACMHMAPLGLRLTCMHAAPLGLRLSQGFSIGAKEELLRDDVVHKDVVDAGGRRRVFAGEAPMHWR
jgi:hypothetical protein